MRATKVKRETKKATLPTDTEAMYQNYFVDLFALRSPPVRF